MTKLPVLSGKVLINTLKKHGFQVVRQKGSHVSLQKGTYKTVVPLHDERHPETVRPLEGRLS